MSSPSSSDTASSCGTPGRSTAPPRPSSQIDYPGGSTALLRWRHQASRGLQSVSAADTSNYWITSAPRVTPEPSTRPDEGLQALSDALLSMKQDEGAHSTDLDAAPQPSIPDLQEEVRKKIQVFAESESIPAEASKSLQDGLSEVMALAAEIFESRSSTKSWSFRSEGTAEAAEGSDEVTASLSIDGSTVDYNPDEDDPRQHTIALDQDITVSKVDDEWRYILIDPHQADADEGDKVEEDDEGEQDGRDEQYNACRTTALMLALYVQR